MKFQASTESELTAFAAATAGITPTRREDSVTVSIAGRFDFHCHQAFRRAYEGLEGVQHYVIDLSRAEYLDSSALGMLLVMRESVEGHGDVKIINCTPAVRRILDIANFHQLFLVT